MSSLGNSKTWWVFCTIILVTFVSGIPAALAALHSPILNSAVPKVRVTGTINDNDRLTLPGSRHPATIDATDRGRVEDTLRLERMILSLKPDPEQASTLEGFLRAVHDPASEYYEKWLTPQEFEQHFGASAKDIAAIKDWLIRNGFEIDEIPAGGRAIVFSGSAAHVRRTFQTEIHGYTRSGKAYIANASEVQIPRALAGVVSGVVSLHDFRSRPMRTQKSVEPNYTVNATTHYLSPADFATIYNLKPLYTQPDPINGSGRSVAILGRSKVDVADITSFRSSMGLPANPPQIILNGADPGYVSGDETESDLDLQWAGATAPAATIKFVTTASTATTDGIDGSALYAVSNDVADVISLSYGLCEKYLESSRRNYYNSLWQQAAAQGITVLVSSGDSGVAGCDSAGAATAVAGAAVNGLCSSPYSTCVGGTEFADTANPALYWASTNDPDLSSALSYIPEAVWNESGTDGGSGLWASGGGASKYFSKPTWQSVTGVPADGKRDVPDVSMTAAIHDGYLIYSSDNATRTRNLLAAGGTSASAPAFAGIMALVNQKTGARQGNANVRMYGLAAIQAGGGRAYFHTTASGNNSVPGQTGFVASSASYNLATGLGSVDGNVLVTHWLDTATSVSISSSSPSIVTGQSLTLTAAMTGASPTGTVQFMDGASNLGSPVSVSGGVAVLSTNLLVTIGNHSITAVYSGDDNNLPSTSTVFVQSVVKASSEVSITSSASAVSLGQSVIFTASVSGVSPTGEVQFMDGGANLGAPVVLNNGAAILSTTELSEGSHSITASYSGDAYNLGGTSSAITLAVTAPIVDGGGAGDSDVPTLPQWGAILLATLLMRGVWRSSARGA